MAPESALILAAQRHADRDYLDRLDATEEAVALLAASRTERSRGSQPAPVMPVATAELATGCRIFSATLAREREYLGDLVTVFLDRLRKAGGKLADYQIRQSSDMGHHCLSIILFYLAPPAFVTA